MSFNNQDLCNLYLKTQVVPRLKADLGKTPHHVTHFPNMDFANVRFGSGTSRKERKHRGVLYDGCYVMVKQQEIATGNSPEVTCHLSYCGDMRGELDPVTFGCLDELVAAVKNFGK